MTAAINNQVAACVLCARQGDYGPVTPVNPRSGLCPECLAAAHPTRNGLERAVVTTAAQSLISAETLSLGQATNEELVYHVAALKLGLRSVLQLIDPRPVIHICGHCRNTTERSSVVELPRGGPEPITRIVACQDCADRLGEGDADTPRDDALSKAEHRPKGR